LNIKLFICGNDFFTESAIVESSKFISERISSTDFFSRFEYFESFSVVFIVGRFKYYQ
tara:strand:+ start:1095 stop:1268 length:174 start_codon:yes stop_codon:yes gene_type:complete